MIEQAILHITETAKIPSFSSYEERLHPYVRSVFEDISLAEEISVGGNNLIFRIGNRPNVPTIALTAHLDKINHFGTQYPDELPVTVTKKFIKGAMDDCAGLGMVLTLAEQALNYDWPNLLFFFSEMEESKGLKEHANLLRNNGKGYTPGMGAKCIAKACVLENTIPSEVITLDTTPLFKGKAGIALYSKHWELNELNPSDKLIESTEKTVARFIRIDANIKIANNTNDYLHYGELFNNNSDKPVVSVALEPSINPYHQKGERVFLKDIKRGLRILTTYLDTYPS